MAAWSLPMNPNVTPAPTARGTPNGCHLTYAEFQNEIREELAAQDWSPQRIANIVSALHSWQRVFGLNRDSNLGAEFSHEFQQSFRFYQDQLATTLAPRTQKDRQEHILLLRRLYDALTIVDLLPAPFHDALTYAIKYSGLSLADVARDSGIRSKVLEDWITRAHTPSAGSFEQLASLERTLRLPPDTLLRRLPLRRRLRYERDQSRAQTHSLRPKQPAILPRGRMFPPTARLEEQWLELIRFKADLTRDGATPRNTWRLKSVDKTGSRILWSMLCDGLVCATAGVHWGFFSSYLSYLTDSSPGKRAIDSKFVDTLAWLAVTPQVKSYVQHLRLAAGNITHNGVVTFLASVRSHLRRKTGFLWCRPEFADDLAEAGVSFAKTIAASSPVQKRRQWQHHCECAYRELIAVDESLTSHGKVRRVRKPDARIKALLADPFPLKALVRGIRLLEGDPPPHAHHRDYVAWIRDVLQLKMLVSNPLRIGQYAAMRFRGPESNLRRTPDGHWRMHFEPDAFKNEKGAACEPYDVALESSVTPWLNRYLSEARPYLLDAENDYLFLPGVHGPNRGAGYEKLGLVPTGMWNADSMTKRIKVVTERYFPLCDAFGPQAFRHVIATDHLKRHPKDYLTVAQLLHDTLASVMKAYAHLEVDDGLRTLHSGVAQAMAELESEDGTR